MHLFEDLFLVENVDEHGRPVPDGAVGHKLLLTNLFNRTQPIIRYELTDMVVIDCSPCPLRSPFTNIAEIRQYRVVHDLDGLHVLVVVRDGISADEVVGRVRAALASTLVAAGASTPKLDVKAVDTLRRDQGHGAKYKLVESRVAVRRDANQGWRDGSSGSTASVGLGDQRRPYRAL